MHHRNLTDERRAYARDVLKRFAEKAYRRPVDEEVVDRLTAIAEGVYSHEGSKFEEGIQRAMIAVLASPRFLFRIEESRSEIDFRRTSAGRRIFAGLAAVVFPVVVDAGRRTDSAGRAWRTAPEPRRPSQTDAQR